MAGRDKEKERARAKNWREENREKYRAYLKSWYEAHREEVREKARERYRKKQEEMKAKHAAYREANREKIRAQKRALYAKKKQQQKNLEGEMIMMEGVELERCPRCGSEAGMKVQGRLYVAGCTKIRCRNWLGKQDAPAGETAETAAAGWNELARDQRAELGEQAKGTEVEKLKSSEVERLEDSEPSFTPPEEEEEEAAAEEAEVVEEEEEAAEEEAAEEEEDEDEAAEEEDTEEWTRFWLELDGKWYYLDEDCEGCEGCAFRLGFGKRMICAAAASTDFNKAVTLCKALQGVWRENSEE